MTHHPLASCLAFACALSLAGADGPQTLRLKVLPLGSQGPVQDLGLKDWKVKLGGKPADVLSQRGPAETGKEPQRWAFVLLPVRDPEMRQLVLQSLATFMTSLPPSDAVLIVLRTDKGMECLTPGFTTRPSLWAKALGRLYDELPARLGGAPQAPFALPDSPTGEAEEGMEPVHTFLGKLASAPMSRRKAEDTFGPKSVTDQYAVDSLGGYAKSVTTAIGAVEGVGAALANIKGERQLVVISRSEVDDLANPVWRQKAPQFSSRDTLNSRLQVETMIRDVTLARTGLKTTLGRLGLTLHSVGGAGATYDGAFGEAAVNTGGYNFRFDMQLPQRLTQTLGTWASRYELTVAPPPGLERPAAVTVETTRPGVRITAPMLQ